MVLKISSFHWTCFKSRSCKVSLLISKRMGGGEKEEEEGKERKGEALPFPVPLFLPFLPLPFVY